MNEMVKNKLIVFLHVPINFGFNGRVVFHCTQPQPQPEVLNLYKSFTGAYVLFIHSFIHSNIIVQNPLFLIFKRTEE